MDEGIRTGRRGMRVEHVVERKRCDRLLLGVDRARNREQQANQEGPVPLMDVSLLPHRMIVMGPVHSACMAGSSTRM